MGEQEHGCTTFGASHGHGAVYACTEKREQVSPNSWLPTHKTLSR